MSTPFTHTPVAPHIDPGFPTQRHYQASGAPCVTRGATAHPVDGVSVMRHAKYDTAQLSINLASFGAGLAEISVHLEAIALRELAQRLLDAAHDIEANPADALAARRQTEAVHA